MESQKAKVAMYVKRSFGDKMNASFDFIKENWKPLFKFATYLILPLVSDSGIEPEWTDEWLYGYHDGG